MTAGKLGHSFFRVNLILVALLLNACSTIAFDQNKPYQRHIEATETTRLGKISADWVSVESKAGFLPLSDGLAAFGARLRLIESAEKSIDMQYFLMKADTAGEIIAGTLLQAADRGVRVRILLDDVFTTVKDDELALLDQHANIEVRLFNPVSRRGFYYLNYAGDFKRANRRMHSKSFTVDGAVTIVGGRNIADEYFQINTDNDFIDFDILAFGPIVPDVAEQFDDFWNSDRAVPITELDHNVSKNDLQDARDDIDDEMRSRTESIYAAAVNAEYMLELIEGTAILYPAEAYLINDKSSKLETPISESEMVVAKKLTDIAQLAKHSITIITPYFVPRKTGVEFWRSIRAKDIELTIVTNSLASTNHVPVHSAYSRYRKPMLEMGAELYEARVDAVNKTGTGGEPETLTLHTKLIVIDDRYLFIGSLNLDPRSIEINAEMGILVDSKEMGKEFQGYLEEDLETWAYKLSLDDKGNTLWRVNVNDEDIERKKEPDTGTWRRFLSKFYRILPESQL